VNIDVAVRTEMAADGTARKVLAKQKAVNIGLGDVAGRDFCHRCSPIFPVRWRQSAHQDNTMTLVELF
jgi:hypothetical protein